MQRGFLLKAGTKRQRKKALKEANKFKMMTEEGIGPERDSIEIELDRLVEEEENGTSKKIF